MSSIESTVVWKKYNDFITKTSRPQNGLKINENSAT